jgi:hypothetical protein
MTERVSVREFGEEVVASVSEFPAHEGFRQKPQKPSCYLPHLPLIVRIQ